MKELEQIAFGTCAQCKVAGQLFGVGYCAHCHIGHLESRVKAQAQVIDEERKRPIDMLLFCPRCQKQHVDAPEPDKGWDNPPHATHTCKFCGLNWRPSNAITNGVAQIPAQEAKHSDRIMASFPATRCKNSIPGCDCGATT
jgi:hypothetical protein